MYMQNENRPTDMEDKLVVPKEKRGGERTNYEYEVNIQTSIHKT